VRRCRRRRAVKSAGCRRLFTGDTGFAVGYEGVRASARRCASEGSAPRPRDDQEARALLEVAWVRKWRTFRSRHGRELCVYLLKPVLARSTMFNMR